MTVTSTPAAFPSVLDGVQPAESRPDDDNVFSLHVCRGRKATLAFGICR